MSSPGGKWIPKEYKAQTRQNEYQIKLLKDKVQSYRNEIVDLNNRLLTVEQFLEVSPHGAHWRSFKDLPSE